MSQPGVDPSILQHVQGDILRNGFPKKAELFFFFTIKDPQAFTENIKNVKIATGEDIRQFRIDMKRPELQGGLLAGAFTNLAFTFRGLNKVGLTSYVTTRIF